MSAIAYDDNPEADEIVIRIFRPDRNDPGSQAVRLTLIGHIITDISGFGLTVNATPVAITSATVTNQDRLHIVAAGSVEGQVALIIPPWIPACNDTQGGVCPGGLIAVDLTP